MLRVGCGCVVLVERRLLRLEGTVYLSHILLPRDSINSTLIFLINLSAW